MKRRALSAILALVLAVSLSVPAFASQYSDLTNHWAKSYMEALAASGYLNGYTDGTMKPDKTITYCETLALLSRFYILTDLQTEMIASKYETTVKAAVPSTLSWAYGNIEICLAAGIITESELKTITFTDNIKKEQLAVYLVRAIQMTGAANSLSGSTLSFADADTVTAASVGSVAELALLGVVKGDNNNNFAPQSTVSRAVVATMMSRTIDYLKAKGTTLKITDYEGLSQAEGIITAASGTSFEITGYDGVKRLYTVSASSVIKINNVSSAFSSSYMGSFATVTAKNSTVVNLAVTNVSGTTWVQGLYTSITPYSSYSTLYMENLDVFAINSYSIPSTVSIKQDGVTVGAAGLKAGSHITLKLVSGVVTEVISVSGDKTLTGTVTLIKYGTTVNLNIKGDNAAEYTFALKIATLPTVLRDTATISFDRLKIGDAVTITIDDCKVKTITVAGTEKSVTGVLKSITTSATGTVWIITNTGGSDVSYTLDEDAVAYSGSTQIPLSTILVGDTVIISTYNSLITEIKLQSSVNTATKVTGTVLKVDVMTAVITILNSDDKLIYVNAYNAASIINSATGSSIYLSAISANLKLVAYGSYTDSRNFKAKSIIIE